MNFTTTHGARRPAWDDETVAPLVLPLPAEVDTPAVVLAGMLMGRAGEVVFDAAGVRTVHATAAERFAAMLRAAARDGARVRIHGASSAVRRRLAGHPLEAFLAAPAPLPADEAVLTCPFLDEPGFLPSLR